MKHANFSVEEDSPHRILLRDLGPWDVCRTITNDAEFVVRQFAPILNGRKLEYIDSEGELTELIIDDNGNFAGFFSEIE